MVTYSSQLLQLTYKAYEVVKKAYQSCEYMIAISLTRPNIKEEALTVAVKFLQLTR